MPVMLSEIFIVLRSNPVLWAVAMIAAMAVTAMVLYVFWDLVGRGISQVANVFNAGQPKRRD